MFFNWPGLFQSGHLDEPAAAYSEITASSYCLMKLLCWTAVIIAAILITQQTHKLTNTELEHYSIRSLCTWLFIRVPVKYPTHRQLNAPLCRTQWLDAMWCSNWITANQVHQVVGLRVLSKAEGTTHCGHDLPLWKKDCRCARTLAEPHVWHFSFTAPS